MCCYQQQEEEEVVVTDSYLETPTKQQHKLVAAMNAWTGLRCEATRVLLHLCLPLPWKESNHIDPAQSESSAQQHRACPDSAAAFAPQKSEAHNSTEPQLTSGLFSIRSGDTVAEC